MVKKDMLILMFKIHRSIPVNIGKIIFEQVMQFVNTSDIYNKYLKFPALIYGMFLAGGGKPLINDTFDTPLLKTISCKNFKGDRVNDAHKGFLLIVDQNVPAEEDIPAFQTIDTAGRSATETNDPVLNVLDDAPPVNRVSGRGPGKNTRAAVKSPSRAHHSTSMHTQVFFDDDGEPNLVDNTDTVFATPLQCILGSVPAPDPSLEVIPEQTFSSEPAIAPSADKPQPASPLTDDNTATSDAVPENPPLGAGQVANLSQVVHLLFTKNDCNAPEFPGFGC
ncbi:hypothetical protein ACFE04_020814 [Oxalis oulophora]